MELNARAIIDAAYANFECKPSREQLTRWLQEYARQHLLFIYTDTQGHPWGQWCGVPERMLPRFKTAADKRSPAPPAKVLADYESEYARAKKSSEDFIDISEDFGNVPNPSEESETFPLGIGIGIGIGVGKGIGIGEKQILASLSAPNAFEDDKPEPTASPGKQHGNRKKIPNTAKQYHPRFQSAFERYPKGVEKSESEEQWFLAVERLMQGERDKPAMTEEEAWEYLDNASADFAARNTGQDPTYVRSMRRWLHKSTYLDYVPKPRVTFIEVPDDQWLGGERLV